MMDLFLNENSSSGSVKVEKAVGYLLKFAIEDRFSKSPQGPKRVNAQGVIQNGLAPRTFFNYLPVIGQEIIVPKVDKWNNDHGIQTKLVLF